MTTAVELIALADKVFSMLYKKGAEKRAEQVEMTHLILKTVTAKGHACLEGQTGTGKSLALLIPAFIWSMTDESAVAISTGTKYLQKQLLESDFVKIADLIKKVMGKAPVIALLKGCGNYASKPRYYNYLRYALKIEAEDPKVAAITKWIESGTITGDLDEISLPDFIPQSAICVNDTKAENEDCFYQKALKQARGADVIVTNHHSVLSRFRLYTAGQLRNPLFEDLNIRTIFFDEGHLLEGVALSLFTKSVSLYEIKNSIASIARFAEINNIGRNMKKGDEKFVDILRRGEKDIKKLMDSLQGYQKDGSITLVQTENRSSHLTYDVIKSSFQQLKKVIVPAAEYAAKLSEAAAKKTLSAAVVTENIEQIDAYMNKMDTIMKDFNASGNLMFMKYSDVHSYPSVIQANNKLKALLSSKWMLFDSLVFTSATLSIPSSKSDATWAYFTEGIGLQQGQYFKPKKVPGAYKVFQSPFDFSNVRYYAPDSALPAPNTSDNNERNRYERYMIRMISHACEHDRKGGIMVLCTSYTDIKALANRLKSHPEALHSRELLVHKKGMSSNELREAFVRLGKKALLLATGAFWTGVDFPNEQLTGLLIPRLPFDTQDDPTLVVRKMSMAAPQKNFFSFAILPAAVMRFRQGIGRLIRTKSDYGSIYVGDSRIYRNTQFELAMAHIKNKTIFKEQ